MVIRANFAAFLLSLPLSLLVVSQTPPPEVKKPAVRVNYLNVCAPVDAEQKEIAAILARIPAKANFAADFEVARGRSTMQDAPPANWVRVRREFSTVSPLLNVQYSISVDENRSVETLVFRMRDPKEVMQISMEDSVSAATPATVVSTDTPANRIKIERFAKPSLGLARCEKTDQSAYEPLFRSASLLLSSYRRALGVRATVPAELARLGSPGVRRQTGKISSGNGNTGQKSRKSDRAPESGNKPGTSQ